MIRDIAIVAYNRPRYLDVTLESLFMANNIQDWRVSIYFDGGIAPDVYQMQVEVISKYPALKVVFGTAHLGCLMNHIAAIKGCFDSEAEEVLYGEDDFIFRKDALDYLVSVPRNATFHCLFGGGGKMAKEYCPIGNLICKDAFAPLYQWVAEKRYAGLSRPTKSYVLDVNTESHDAVFFAYLLDKGLYTQFPDKSYTAHFGLTGLNYKKHATEEERELEEYMFSGRRSTWLNRIIGLVERKEKLPTLMAERRLVPSSFRYDNGK